MFTEQLVKAVLADRAREREYAVRDQFRHWRGRRRRAQLVPVPVRIPPRRGD
jgi:hypothetical protein